MSLRLDEKLIDFLREVRESTPDQKIYLVGGAVRDIVLGRTVKDLDFVVADRSVQLAKKVQRLFSGVWYSLDDEHQTARVILRQGQIDEFVLDFTAFIGGGLEEDLRQRDFTINAMAIDLDNLNELIDPLGGQDDLKNRRLHLSNPDSLLSDPLRVLRAVRMVRTFSLRTTPEIIEKLRVATGYLNKISGERIRDELLKCLALPDFSLTYSLLKEYGILQQLLKRVFSPQPLKQAVAYSAKESPLSFDELVGKADAQTWQKIEVESKTAHNLLQTLERLLLHIEGDAPDHSILEQCPISFFIPDTIRELNHYLEEILQGGRTRKQLLILFGIFYYHHPAFLSDGQEMSYSDCLEFSEQLTSAFMLGQKEQQFFEFVCAGYWNIFSLNQEAEVNALEIYRYFRQVGSCGVESALLRVVNCCASKSCPEDKISLAETIIFTWFREHDMLVEPPRLVDGDDLQKILHLSPGPDLGYYLESIREAQITGEVTNSDEALSYVARIIRERKNYDRKSI